jgi:hypothetical protein
MNVLILTPDRVGSTMLQRFLTIFMLRKGFGKPVINLHELTNGIAKVIDENTGEEKLRKDFSIMYGQSLSEIQDLLENASHYVTSRLANYHIKKRQDTIQDQIPFYEFLNENFYIISCRRENLFEHVLSWIISANSKKLNVYSPEEKVNAFADIYKNGVTAHKEFVESKLNDYKDYLQWVDVYFDVQSYFNYDDYINNVEEYILNLDFMTSEDNTWQDMFGIEFSDWNTMYKTIPDCVLKEPEGKTKTLRFMDLSDIEKYKTLAGSSWPTLEQYIAGGDANNENVNNEIVEAMPEVKSITVPEGALDFMSRHLESYVKTSQELEQLSINGYLPIVGKPEGKTVSSLPVKLQTLKEKLEIIKNVDECIEWYNDWVTENGIGELFDKTQLDESIRKEEEMFSWENKLPPTSPTLKLN